MKPRITLLTLGVDDLERAVAFYRDGLGWPPGHRRPEFENGAVAFFKLEAACRLALWPRNSMAADTGLPLQARRAPPSSRWRTTSARRPKSTRRCAQAEPAGARIVKPAQRTFYGGYAGYFQDPDGHLWEVAFNPHFKSLG